MREDEIKQAANLPCKRHCWIKLAEILGANGQKTIVYECHKCGARRTVEGRY